MLDATLVTGTRISWTYPGSDAVHTGPLVKVCKNGALVVGTETAEGFVDGHAVIGRDQVVR